MHCHILLPVNLILCTTFCILIIILPLYKKTSWYIWQTLPLDRKRVRATNEEVDFKKLWSCLVARYCQNGNFAWLRCQDDQFHHHRYTRRRWSNSPSHNKQTSKCKYRGKSKIYCFPLIIPIAEIIYIYIWETHTEGFEASTIIHHFNVFCYQNVIRNISATKNPLD